jgi:hypothetical protein
MAVNIKPFIVCHGREEMDMEKKRQVCKVVAKNC